MREHRENMYPAPLHLACCPYCGTNEYTIMEEDHENGETDLPFFVECPECHARGPVMPTMELATKYWLSAMTWHLKDLPIYRAKRFLDDVLSRGDVECGLPPDVDAALANMDKLTGVSEA